MSKEIPYFSVEKINKIDDYERFYHSKAYLKKKSGKLTYFKNKVDEIKDLANKSGYSKFNKFLKHRKEWHKMQRKIPIKYLDAIGVKLDVLKFTVELDQKEFKEVLKLNFKPRYASVKLHPIVYRSYEFPPDITEEEAIEIIKDYALNEGKLCFINYPNIKLISVNQKGEVNKSYFKPEIKVGSEYVYPAKDGVGLGKVYIS